MSSPNAYPSDDSNVSAPLQLSLYENAIDSIQHGIEHYVHDQNEARRYKYAILHLSQGVVLLLKERLRLEHPNFIYSPVTDPSRTVDVHETIARLEKIAHVELDEYKKLILDLAWLRNGIEHFAMDVSKQQADSLIGRTVPFLVDFCRNELDRDFPSEIGAPTWRALHTIESYLTVAIKTTEQRIKREGKPAYRCPSCKGNTATETVRKGQTEWDLEFTVVSCRVCLNEIFIRTHCRECGKEIIREARSDDAYPIYGYKTTVDPCVANYSYCSDCDARLRQEFPAISSPRFVAELRRWFRSHSDITTQQLFHLLANAQMAGPTGRPQHLLSVYREGIIDFVNEEDRNQYLEAYRPYQLWAGFDDDVHFKWVYRPAIDEDRGE